MIGKFAACVGVFSHATANLDIMKSIQEELATIALELRLDDEDDDSTNIMENIEYSLVRRNDTRWIGNHMMMDRLLKLKESIDIFLICKQNKYLLHVVDNIIFGISVPDYPSSTLKPRFWDNSVVSLIPWQSGKILVWDARCPDTFASSHRAEAVKGPDLVAAKAENTKKL